ncbi:MAG: hypothetical protein JRI46_01470 [Deltaproteobacteria bacterium]|nr:hypothetical protein [Deltaproteobacteria bacterium]
MGQKIIGKFSEEYCPRYLTWEERLDLLQGLQQRVSEEIGRIEEFQTKYHDRLATVASAGTVGELKELHQDLNQLTLKGFLESYSVRGTHELCSAYRDKITERLLVLVQEEMVQEGFGPLPTPYAWLTMGSNGRREQVLFTDQDDLLVYRYEERGVEQLWKLEEGIRGKLVKIDIGETPTPPKKRDILNGYYEIFSRKMVQRLDEIGIEKCKGGVMPSNEKWRGSLMDWKERVEGKVNYDTGILTTLDLIILMDLRYVGGDQGLAEELISSVNEHIEENQALLNEMVRSAIFMPIPLGLFNRFITERSGEHKGKLNLKLGGWAPLVLIVRILARRHRLSPTNTMQRIKELRELDVFTAKFAAELQEAYYVLVKHRILHQVELIREGMGNDNYIDPYSLSDEEQAELKDSLRRVEALQKRAHNIFLAGGVMG